MRKFLYLLLSFFMAVAFSSVSLGGVNRATGSSDSTPVGACYTDVAAACAHVYYTGVVTTNTWTYVFSAPSTCGAMQNGTFNHNLGFVTCDSSCPAGQYRIDGMCGTCPAGQSVQSNNQCGCPTGQVYDAPICHAPCASNQVWNSTLQQCEGPCTQSQYDSAVAASAGQQDKVTVSTALINGGLRVVTESTTISYACVATCRVKHSQFIRVGNITNTSYEVKDWGHWDVEHTGCDVMPTGSSTSTDLEIGRKPDGGCRPGFAYGEVNGVAGCYGSPYSGGADGSGGGGPQNNGGNPGGSDGAGNDSTGTNQNGAGGACNAGYHDVGGVCVPDTSVSGGGSGDNGSGQCLPGDTRAECLSGMPDHTHGEAQTFGEALNNFRDGVAQTPIASTISGMGNLIPSGSANCPAPGFDVFGSHYVVDMHCVLYEQVASTLSALMMVIWTFIGLRIIASA